MAQIDVQFSMCYKVFYLSKSIFDPKFEKKMQIVSYNSNAEYLITTNIYTCTNNIAVGACAKFCGDTDIQNYR